MHTLIRTHAYTHTHTHTHTLIHTLSYTHMHTHAYTHMHTLIHTHACTIPQASRSRYQYWLHAYLKQLATATSKPLFMCTLIAPSKAKEKERTDEGKSASSPTKKAHITRAGEEIFFDAMVLDLGSFQTYRLYCPLEFKSEIGGEIRCHIHKFGDTGSISDFVFLPAQLDVKTVPSDLLKKWP